MLTDTGTMRRQLTRGLAVTGVLAAGLAGLSACSSGSGQPPSPSASASQSIPAQQQREQQLEPVIVGCLVKQGLIPAKDVQSQSWYSNGQVKANNDFVVWWHNFEGLPVKLNGSYQHLDDVVRSAASGDWPASVCGPAPSGAPAAS